jgi:uncharacterized membrane protein (UPF0127 family)
MGRLRVERLAARAGRLVDERGEVLFGRCHVASGLLARTVGLLGTAGLEPDEAVWIEPCASVHTLGMRFPLAVAFVAADGRVLRVVDPLPVWRAASARGARAVVEAGAGAFAGRVPARLVLAPPGAEIPH